MRDIIRLSEHVCVKAGYRWRDRKDAYEFAKILSSLTEHPILKNFRANFTGFRLKTRYSDKRFRMLLNSAISYGFAYYEGNHLRLFSRNQERRFINFRRRPEYQDVEVHRIAAFIEHALIRYDLIKQQKAIKSKKSSDSLKTRVSPSEQTKDWLPTQHRPVNDVITLSCRSAAKALGCSLSHAHAVLQKHKAYGLVLNENRTNITREQFLHLLTTPFKGMRFDRRNKQFYYLSAQTATYEHFCAPKSLTPQAIQIKEAILKGNIFAVKRSLSSLSAIQTNT